MRPYLHAAMTIKEKNMISKIVFLILMICTVGSALASGHGPNFGLATPTNVRGGWSLDVGFMGRRGTDDVEAMLRTMLGYGITEDLQLSITAPWMLQSAPLSPARQIAMMPGNDDLEITLAWRFHRRDASIGKRVESTAFGGFVYPTLQNSSGMMGNLESAPGFLIGGTTGYASRSSYLWAGAMYTYFSESEGDQRPHIFFYSLVWGYRPQSWRSDYPRWDWRIFLEATGERSNRFRIAGQKVSDTESNQIFFGPGTLGIYKNFAVAGGIQVPVYRSVGIRHEKEKLRYSLNVSYFF